MTDAPTLRLNWEPTGPVAARFFASNAQFPILNGPIGSGKTTAGLMQMIMRAATQTPSTRDRIRNSRGELVKVRKFWLCVVRDTYRQLWRATLPSWWSRVPKEIGTWSGAIDGPATHRIQFELGDGTMVDFQADFVAIGDTAVEEVLRGYSPTAFLLDEADLLAEEVYIYAASRAGRFPEMIEGGPSWYGVVLICNAPEFNNWLYKSYFLKSAAELDKMGVALFRQPSGLSPDAENIRNLPPGYYTRMAANQPEWFIIRMIRNQPGFSRAGKAIYPEFNDTLHVSAEDLEMVVGLPLVIGLDAGLNPAAVFLQRMPNGQWRVLWELTSEPGTGSVRFAESLARVLHQRFPQARNIRAWADPSAAYGADAQAGEQSWIQIVSAKAEIRIDAAPTNKLIPRLDAVRGPLTRLIDGQPGMLVSPACKTLREGFASGYRFRKMNTKDERYAEEPDKNAFSHIHDALQYPLSAGGEDLAIRERAEDRRTTSQRVQHVTDFDPHG